MMEVYMKITKTSTKTYEILQCVKWKTTFGEFKEARKIVGLPIKKFEKCFICGEKFKEYDPVYLAIIKKEPNRFICEKCADKV
jgi:hypothetical protein